MLKMLLFFFFFFFQAARVMEASAPSIAKKRGQFLDPAAPLINFNPKDTRGLRIYHPTLLCNTKIQLPYEAHAILQTSGSTNSHNYT